METIKLSNFDRLLNIHQSVALHQTNKINKRILEQQIHQNAKLQHLNNQLAAANEINRQILKNQIAEIEKKEKQKFYKDLSFKMHVFLEPISNITDPLVKKYFIDRYYEKLKTNILSAEEYLEEINDKLFNKEIYSKITTLKEVSDNHNSEFENSLFSKIDIMLEELKNERNKISNVLPPVFNEVAVKVKPRISTLRTIGLLLFGGINFLLIIATLGSIISKDQTGIIIISIMLILFLIPFFLILRKGMHWKKSYHIYIQQQQQLINIEQVRRESVIKEYQDTTIRLNDQLTKHPSYLAYKNLVSVHPEFDRTISIISDLEQKYFPMS